MSSAQQLMHKAKNEILYNALNFDSIVLAVFRFHLRELALQRSVTTEVMSVDKTVDRLIDLGRLIDGNIVAGRFQIGKHIYSGIYPLKFQVNDNEQSGKYAMKVDLPHQRRNRLYKEAFILKRLSDCPHVSKYVEYGSYSGIDYLVLTMVGPDLTTIRKRAMDRNFDLGTVLRIGIQCAEALSAVHEAGFVLRDVRPENFAIGLHQDKDVISIVDFGAALQIRFDVNNFTIRPEMNASFCGSRLHASFNAHYGLELSPHDDIISLFYMMADLYLGKLPWTNVEDFKKIGELKRTCKADVIFGDMPDCIKNMYRALKRFTYGELFNHSEIIEQLTQAADILNAPKSLRLDEPDVTCLKNVSMHTASLRSAKKNVPRRSKSV
ncbi:Pkinase domain containing protein [Trichuris trichiura]|uniref:Pkinase domain containing protein n=1 Tax=Trichuris trichiura TaxID=36087 RepID=A0A077ZG82_TRITR|nr:Pkinase domain containing protein [Trichuris trichiura]